VLEVLRQEKKYVINFEQYYTLSHLFAQVLREDKHSSGNGYTVRSLYFDSLDDRDYEEKIEGIDIRKKIRLRNYGPDSTHAKLEMKQKQGAMQRKRSLTLNPEQAKIVSTGDYSPLLEIDTEFSRECYGLMLMQCYRPKAVISYTRKVFLAEENEIRITFDQCLKGTESCLDIFSENLVENMLFDQSLVVMEVKYNGFLLSYIKDMINKVNAQEVAVSKYCIGRAIGKEYLYI